MIFFACVRGAEGCDQRACDTPLHGAAGCFDLGQRLAVDLGERRLDALGIFFQFVRHPQVGEEDGDQLAFQRRRRAPARTSVCRRVEVVVLVEDRLLETLQAGARLDAELLDENQACVPVGLERLRPSTRAVEREHELPTESLPEGVLGDERLEFPDKLGVTPEREVGLDSLFHRCRTQAFEPPDLGLGERLERELGERGSTPEAERIVQGSRRTFGIALC